ncbi:unnamed protein product, partial [Callosobruchus maculatus]
RLTINIVLLKNKFY